MILIQVKDKLKEPKIVSQPGDKAVADIIEVEGAPDVAITSGMPDEERQPLTREGGAAASATSTTIQCK